MGNGTCKGLRMRSPVAKRSITVEGHRTSVTLEQEFWSAAKEIAECRRLSLSELVGEIDRNRTQNNLSSAIRLSVLSHYRTKNVPPNSTV